jgi:hypothetical protein
MPVRIFMLKDRFVYIGIGKAVNDELLGKSILIKQAQNIRRWGTDKNIGQLATDGKQEETVLDYTGTITVPLSQIHHSIELSKKSIKSFEYETENSTISI